jgi:hypothetical protein
MSPARRQPVEPLSDEERAQLEVQTRRNLDALELEGAGRTDQAVALYERNVAEGFTGDWPYSRLVSLYERQGKLEEAERVLRRAIAVTRADRRRPASDRRVVVQGLQGRLRVLKKSARAAREAASTGSRRGHHVVPLPVLDDP